MLLREPARPAVVREHPLAPWLAVATVCFGAFMGQLDASIVTLAFPALQRQFGVALAGVQWVSLAYLLALVALLVPVGRWSDRYRPQAGVPVRVRACSPPRRRRAGWHRRWACWSRLRVLQAAGAAMLQANSVALVATSAPAGRRRAALGMQAAAQALGLALGPVAGGLLVASAGWRSIFFINVPVGVVAVAAGWFLLPRTRHRAAGQGADPAGLMLLAAAATGTLVAVSAVSGLGLPLPGLAGCAAVALLAAVGPGVVGAARSAAPLVDLPMLAAAGTWPLLAGALCAYLVLFGPLVLIPQVLTAHGGSALHAGLLLSALPAGFGLAAVAGGEVLPAALAGPAPLRRPADCWPAAAPRRWRSPLPDIVMATWLGLLGVGLGVYIPANNTAIMTAIPAREAAAAGGMVNMARGLGTALGVAVVTLALHAAARLGHARRAGGGHRPRWPWLPWPSAWAGRRAGAGRSRCRRRRAEPEAPVTG